MTRAAYRTSRPSIIPPLNNGDRLTRAEFERRFDATPGLKMAELIEGIVYMPPPISVDHSHPHEQLITWFGSYEAATPGVFGGGSSSLRLDLDNMPQPDAFLMIQPPHGQARISEDRYVEGAPELIGEISATTASFDLNTKMNVYRRSGVREYIVWRTLDREIDYFILREGRFERLPTDKKSIWRSECFPGLWLDGKSMLAGDLATVLDVLKRGTGSREHRNFVARLRKGGVR